MNISTRKKVALSGTLAFVAFAGVFDLANGNKIFRASVSFFDNPTFKWGALFAFVASTIAGAIYLLATKNALKRKVTEYGEISFVVVNGKPRRYRWGKRKGHLVVRREGQAKNVIPKLRDQVTVSWLYDELIVRNLDGMYDKRVIKYDLTIAYTMPEPKTEQDKEALAAMTFGFRDRNRYNEQPGNLEQHLENRCTEAVTKLIATAPKDDNGLPVIVPENVAWMEAVTFRETVRLTSLRVSILNLRFPQQLEFYKEPEPT